MELGYSAEALTRTLFMLDLPYWMDETYLYTLFAGMDSFLATSCTARVLAYDLQAPGNKVYLQSPNAWLS